MDKFIIYVNYSSYEYDTYYHLICNGEPVLSYRLEKDIDELIQRIKENIFRKFLFMHSSG